jgi:hypothetical protein
MFTVAVAIVIGVLSLMDPYSHGSMGGDVVFVADTYWWQTAVVALDFALLAGTVLCVVRRQWNIARLVLIANVVLFVGVNLFYAVRHGATRFTVGFESSYQTAWVLAAAFLLRLLLLIAMWRLKSAPDERGEHSASARAS